MIGLTRRKVLLTGAAIGLLGRSVLASEIKHEVKLPDGLGVPSLGQGTFQLAEGRRPLPRKRTRCGPVLRWG